MALMKCPECKESISDKASFCPHCGFPITENTTETTYEIEKGKPLGSGLATFLMVLAWITWIGGLIISIAGANITVQGYYSNHTEFSFTTFLALIIPYIIYGSLLMGMSTLVHQISDTYDMVQGLKLTKISAQNKPSYPSRNQSSSRLTSDSSVNANKATEQENESTKQDGPDIPETDEYGWIIDSSNPAFVQCPACGKKYSAINMKNRKVCFECGHEHVLQSQE